MSGTTIRELITRLGFDIDDEKLDLFERKVSKVKSNLTALTVAGLGTVAGLIAITKSAANAGDDLDAQASLFGIAIDQLQIWTRAAALGDIEAGEFTSSLQFLNRNLGDAARDAKGPAAKVFRELGITLKNSAGQAKNSGVVLNELSEKFKTITDPAKRASIAMDIFGRGGQRMGRFLSESSGYIERATAIVSAFGMYTEESGQLADSANDAWEDTVTLMNGLKNEIGIGLLPVMKDVLTRFNNFLMANRELIKTKLDKFVATVTKGFYSLWRIAVAVTKPIVYMVKALGGIENVAKLATVALLAMGGASVYGAISALISLVAALGISIGAVLLETVGIPLLIGLAVTNIALVFEDLYGWINGSDSLIGDWLGSWSDFTATAGTEFKDFLEGLGVIWTGVSTLLNGIWETMSGAFGIFVALWKGDLEGFKKSFMLWIRGIGHMISSPLLLAFGAIETAVTLIIELLKGAFKIVVGMATAMIPPSLMKLISFIGTKAVQGGHAVADAFDGYQQGAVAGYPGGASPAAFAGMAPAPTPGGAGVVNHFQVSAPVTVPAGTTEQQAAFLKDTMEQVAEETFGRHISHVLQNNPRRE